MATLLPNTNYEIQYSGGSWGSSGYIPRNLLIRQLSDNTSTSPFYVQTTIRENKHPNDEGYSISISDGLNLQNNQSSEQFLNTLFQFCRVVYGEDENPWHTDTKTYVHYSVNSQYYSGNYFLTSVDNYHYQNSYTGYWCLLRTSSSFTFSKMDYGNKLAYIQNFPMNVQEGEFEEVCCNLLNVIATALVNCDCDLQNLYLSQTLSVSDYSSESGSSGSSVDLTGIETKLQNISDNLKATVNIDNVETDLNVAQTIVELNNTLDEKELTVFNELDISDKLSMIPKRSGYPNDDLQF